MNNKDNVRVLPGGFAQYSMDLMFRQNNGFKFKQKS